MPRKSFSSTSLVKFHNSLSDYLHTVQRICTTHWLIYLSHFGAFLSIWFSCLFILELKAVAALSVLCVGTASSTVGFKSGTSASRCYSNANNCQWNPGLVPLDTYIILGVLICLLTLSASLRLGSMPCYRGNVHTVKAVMPNHFPKRLPLWVVKCIFLFYFHSIIYFISRERFFFFSSHLQFNFHIQLKRR